LRSRKKKNNKSFFAREIKKDHPEKFAVSISAAHSVARVVARVVVLGRWYRKNSIAKSYRSDRNEMSFTVETRAGQAGESVVLN
jgi:hypothetical protein